MRSGDYCASWISRPHAPPPTLPGKKNDSLNQKNPQPDNTDQAHLKGVMKALARILTS